MVDQSRDGVGCQVNCRYTLFPFTRLFFIAFYNQALFGHAFRQSIRIIVPGKGYRRVKGSSIRAEVVGQTDNVGIFGRVWRALIKCCLYPFQSPAVFIQGKGALGDDKGEYAILRGGFYCP